MPPEIRQHGVKGVYHAGEWLDMEDCDGVFTNIEAECSGCNIKGICPRSQSRLNASSLQSGGTSYDVVIIGAGCIGAAIARELAKYQLTVLWLEAADDVSQGATKGNSGIVHAGYDDKPGTNRSKYCWPGNQMFPDLDKDLNFGYQKNGSLVLATGKDEVKILKDLLKRGEKNGVKNLRILEKDELFKMEPHVNPNAIAALYSPDAGNVIPYEFAIALAENAVDNGVELRIRREVTGIEPIKDGFQLTVNYWEPKAYVTAMREKGIVSLTSTEMVIVGLLPIIGVSLGIWLGVIQPFFIRRLITFVIALLLLAALSHKYLVPASVYVRPHTPVKTLVMKAGVLEGQGGPKVSVDDMKVGGSGSRAIQQGRTMNIETVKTKYVINCAGSYSDKIAKMIGDKSFRIKPRLGDYILLNRNQGYLTTKTLFPCPDPVLGKGVLVQTTLWGNLILGPTARDMYKPEAANMSASEIQKYILSKCKNLVPSFDAKETIHAFCGARSKSDRGDWIIENSTVDGRMIHVAGIDSPGLAGSPAIAIEVMKLLEESGCKLTKDVTFNPRRAPIITPKNGMKGLKMGPPGKNDSYDQTHVQNMSKNVICKCEKVTELEVVRAIRRSLPIDSTQAIRKRTRAGMGHCQGDPENYNCEARVKAIIARELGTPMSLLGGRPWPATSSLSQRWPGKAELEDLETLMHDPNQPAVTDLSNPPFLLELEGIFDSGFELGDPESPQSFGYNWILHQDELSFNSTNRPSVQRFILATFYFATGGRRATATWSMCSAVPVIIGQDNVDSFSTPVRCVFEQNINVCAPREQFLACPEPYQGLVSPPHGPKTRWLSKSSECDWFGVSCNEEGKVHQLSLQNNGLTGMLISELNALPDLNHLDWTTITWRGHCPPSTMWIYNTCPCTVTGWRLLEKLDLGGNEVASTPPDTFGYNWKNLVYLKLVNSQVSRTLQTGLLGLTSLISLELQNNDLSGTLPDFLWDLHLLKSLRLENNQFSGTLSSYIGNLVNLSVLSIAETGLSGTIPTELSHLSHLEMAAFQHNEFSGVVPGELCNELPLLQTLEADCLRRGLDCACCTLCCPPGKFDAKKCKAQ